MDSMNVGGIKKRWLFFYMFISLSSLNAANWSSSPTTLNPLTLNGNEQATIVVDTSGNVAAAWLETVNGNVVVEGAYFSINSSTWSAAAILSNPAGTAETQPLLVVDQSGNVTVVWIATDGGGFAVQAARFSGGSWTGYVTLDAGQANEDILPQMVVDVFGNVTVLWLEKQGDNFGVQVSSFSGGSWSLPVTLEGNETPNAITDITPQIVVDVFGNLTVVWAEQTGENRLIESAFFVVGEKEATPIVLNNITFDANSGASIVVDTSGNVTAAWLENVGGNVVVEAAYVLINSSAWSAPTILSNPAGTAETPPQLVVDQSSNVTVTWDQVLGGGFAVEASRFSGGTWSSAVILDNGTQTPNAFTIDGASFSSILVDSSGNVTVVWFEQQGDDNALAVQAARFSGGSWTTSPVTLNGSTLNADNGTAPQVVVDAFGDVTVVWGEVLLPEEVLAVQAARFSGGSWTTSPVTLNGNTLNSFGLTAAVVDTSGNVTVAWLEGIGDVPVVEAARFSGGAWSSTVILDNGTQTPQTIPIISPQLVVDGSDNVTVAWLENPAGGATFPVQVARFALSSPNINLFPPANLNGYQQINRFLTQSDYINILQWNIPSLGEIPTAYNIYRDVALTDLVSVVNYIANQQLEFLDHNRRPMQLYNYSIVSVDAQGNVSTPTSIVVQ